MKQYSVALKLNYDGKAVATGARKNAADMQQLIDANKQLATQSSNTINPITRVNSAVAQQGNTSQVTANRNNQLANTDRVVATQSIRASQSVDKLATSAQAQATRSTQAAKQNTLLGNSYRNLAGALSAYLGAQGAISFVGSIEQSELLTLRIKNLTTSLEQNAEVQDYLATASDRLNLRYSILAESYAGMLVLEKAQIQTSTESRALLEGMTNAAKELGATNNQVAQSFFGYKQAATQGTVQTTELLQVTEPMPGLLQAMDRASGLAAGGFKKLTGEGKVTSQFFKDTLIKALDEYKGAAENASGSINAARNDFLTTYDLIAQKLQQPVNSAVVPAIEAGTDALKLLGDNVDVLGDLADGVVLLSTVLAGRLVSSLGASAAATVRKAVATQQARAADLAKATAALNVAKAEQTATREMFANAQGLRTRTALMTQASAASTRLAAATTRYTAAVRSASVANRGLSASMAFLGGPIGIITTAALAVTYFASSANDAQIPTHELTASVKGLTDGFDQLTSAQLKARDVNVSRKVDDFNSRIDASKNKIKELQRAATEGVNLGRAGATIELSEERKKQLNDDILLQQAELEQLEKSKTRLLAAQVEIHERIKSGPVAKPQSTTPTSSTNEVESVDYSQDIAKLEGALQNQEQRIATSYANRQSIINNALAAQQISEQKFWELSAGIQIAKAEEVAEIKRQKEEDALRLAREKREAELRGVEERYEAELRLYEGFSSRKEQLEYEHNERVFALRTRNTGAMQSTLQGFANFEKKTELEKTKSVIQLGEFGFKAAAQQSKKAFALYKAFSITKALINTYEMATGAYNSLVGIPYVGPALAVAGAAAATAFGIAQVNSIKGQQYAGAAHGGRDYIPEEQTYLLQRGERVVSPRQNVALSQAVERINKGSTGGGQPVSLVYKPTFNIQNTGEDSMNKLQEFEEDMQQRMMAKLNQQLVTGTGPFYQSVRQAVA